MSHLAKIRISRNLLMFALNGLLTGLLAWAQQQMDEMNKKETQPEQPPQTH